MNVRIVALLAALLPFVAVHATYLAAAAYGQVEWCLPYLDSCASISATGRQPPASFLFRATMLPAAVVLAAYWWLNHAWLAELHRRAGGRRPANDWMLGLGMVASLGLILYVTVLGEAGTAWGVQRRAGTVLFFSLTWMAQLLLLAQLRSRRGQLPSVPEGLLGLMGFCCVALLATGVLTVMLQAWNGAWYATVEDAFEWCLALMLQANFLLGYLVWRRARWQLRVRLP